MKKILNNDPNSPLTPPTPASVVREGAGHLDGLLHRLRVPGAGRVHRRQPPGEAPPPLPLLGLQVRPPLLLRPRVQRRPRQRPCRRHAHLLRQDAPQPLDPVADRRGGGAPEEAHEPAQCGKEGAVLARGAGASRRRDACILNGFIL